MSQPFRIVLPALAPEAREIVIKDNNFRYLRDVLRCRIGDKIVVLDGKGHAVIAGVSRIGRRDLVLKKEGDYTIDSESPLKLVLLQVILKGDGMDFVIQKSTELGVSGIYPVVTGRAQVRYTRRLEHWRRIAEEAVRQSGRLILPEIHDVLSLDELFLKIEDGERIIFYEHEASGFRDVYGPKVEKRPGKVYYMVGPEGGFTEDEVERAVQEGFRPLGLGRRTLRAETASVAAATLLQFLFGDL